MKSYFFYVLSLQPSKIPLCLQFSSLKGYLLGRSLVHIVLVVQLLSRVWLFVTPMDCSTPGFPVHHQFPKFAQTHVHWVDDAIQPSHPPAFSSCLQSFPASVSFQMSQFLTSGGQSTGVSASASVLPMNIQDWFPLGLTGLISLQWGTDSQVSSLHHSSEAFLWLSSIWLHQFFGVQLSL